MKTVHWNGERWYENHRPLLMRVRQWFVWLGGWEKANGAGWRLPWGQWRYSDPTPISLLGHRIKAYNLWGGARAWADVSWGSRWLHISRDRGYLSIDGTPSNADCWLWGWPQPVEQMDPPAHDQEARP